MDVVWTYRRYQVFMIYGVIKLVRTIKNVYVKHSKTRCLTYQISSSTLYGINISRTQIYKNTSKVIDRLFCFHI